MKPKAIQYGSQNNKKKITKINLSNIFNNKINIR